ELSITLKMKVLSHSYDYKTVFSKGSNYTPAFRLKPDNSTPCIFFSITDVPYILIDMDEGRWVGSYSLKNIQSQSIIFNDGPLYIGDNPHWGSGFNGEI
ncbi:1711_t:CDS:2, partial [Racocetra persica]